MASRRIGGLISFKIGGTVYSAKGNFTYNIGVDKKEKIVGADGVHGHKIMPVIPYIEGQITDNSDLDLVALREAEDITATLELANGKTIVIEDGVEASDGEGSSEEGELQLRIEGQRGREIPV